MPNQTPQEATMGPESEQPPTGIDYIHPEDPDDEWTVERTGRTLRVQALTGVLIVLVVLAGGFWGGVVAEKHHNSGTSATGTSAFASILSRLRSGAGAAGGTGATGTGGFTGGGGFTGAGTNTATGTVVGVQGNTLQISTSSGTLIKVEVPSSVTVTRTTKSSLAGLQIGDTVVVAGAAGSNGTVAATSVRATAQGVTSSSGFGGFGGGGGFGSGTGGG